MELNESPTNTIIYEVKIM